MKRQTIIIAIFVLIVFLSLPLGLVWAATGDISGVNVLSFSQGSNFRIGTNSSGLLFDGGDGNWDFLVYDNDIRADTLRLGYSGSALLTTNDTNEDLSINPNGTGSLNIDNTTLNVWGSGAGRFIRANPNDTGYILSSYNSSASNAEQFNIRHNNGSVEIRNERGSVGFTAGNVGIGLASPSSLLHIRNGDLMIENDSATGGTGVARLLFSEGAPSAQMRIEYDGDNEGGDSNRLAIVSAKNNNEILTVTYGERVGIGTTLPNSTLDVRGSVRGNYDINTSSYFGRTAIGYCSYSDYACIAHVNRNSAGNYALLQSSSGQTYLNAASGQNIFFRINNDTQMTMSSAGNFGIGTTDPAGAKLVVNMSEFQDIASFQQNGDTKVLIGYNGGVSIYGQTTIYDNPLRVDGSQMEDKIILSTSGGYTEIAQRSWSGSDAILFSAYASDAYGDGGINAFGNTKHAYNASQFGSSDHRAKAIATDHNRIRFLISGTSPGSGQNVDWNTKMNIGISNVEIITPTVDLANLGSTYSEYLNVNIGGGPGSATNLNMKAGEWNNINFSGIAGGTPPAAIQYSVDYGYIGFRTGSVNNRMTIQSNGNVEVGGALVHSSDRRLKENIKELDYGLAEIMNLNPVFFNWKDRVDNRKSIGLIAQEVQPFLSELVYENTDQEGGNNILGVNYEGIIPVLIKAVQELKNETDTLKQEIYNLKQ